MRSFQQGLFDWIAVALAELRTVRRLVRTWVFLALGISVVGTKCTCELDQSIYPRFPSASIPGSKSPNCASTASRRRSSTSTAC